MGQVTRPVRKYGASNRASNLIWQLTTVAPSVCHRDFTLYMHKTWLPVNDTKDASELRLRLLDYKRDKKLLLSFWGFWVGLWSMPWQLCDTICAWVVFKGISLGLGEKCVVGYAGGNARKGEVKFLRLSAGRPMRI